MYLDFSIRWEAILQYDALTTEPFQSQQTRLLNAICDFGQTIVLRVSKRHEMHLNNSYGLSGKPHL